MRSKTPTKFIALTLLALAISGCAQRGQVPVANLDGDDDAICRANNVAAGSPEYVACIKNRDAQRANATNRADSAQRKLGEYMINNPVRP
ncbi:MAG TPA: hypothetical protein VN941_01565 [Bradyrhizobium sp.]|nr:hypothetical protein [Bradyrhizobium sp.]